MLYQEGATRISQELLSHDYKKMSKFRGWIGVEGVPWTINQPTEVWPLTNSCREILPSIIDPLSFSIPYFSIIWMSSRNNLLHLNRDYFQPVLGGHPETINLMIVFDWGSLPDMEYDLPSVLFLITISVFDYLLMRSNSLRI